MVRDDSLSRGMMLICFGAAVVLLSAAWLKPAEQFPKSSMTNSRVSRQRSNYKMGSSQVSSWKLSGFQLPTLQLPSFQLPGVNLQFLNPPTEPQTRLVVDLSERRVYVHRSNQLITSYRLAVGQAGWETPVGSFQVSQMNRQPVWRQPITGEIVPPGPENPLGERWIGFWSDGRHVIGFHGTNEEELIGQAVSHGCLRMRNQDIRAMYEQLEIGTPVIVRD